MAKSLRLKNRPLCSCSMVSSRFLIWSFLDASPYSSPTVPFDQPLNIEYVPRPNFLASLLFQWRLKNVSVLRLSRAAAAAFLAQGSTSESQSTSAPISDFNLNTLWRMTLFGVKYKFAHASAGCLLPPRVAKAAAAASSQVRRRRCAVNLPMLLDNAMSSPGPRPGLKLFALNCDINALFS